MLQSRLIPVLLVRDKGLTKTVKFKDGKYVGDPLNAVKIFNEKEVDELIVLDIDATAQGRLPDFNMIGHLAAECRMPLCYGGGINNLEQAQSILSSGVEKVSFSSNFFTNPDLISDLSSRVGKQSVVVVLDVKKKLFGSKYECYTHNGTKGTKCCPIDAAKKAQKLGAGELVINSIDNDGVMKGYDLSLIKKIRDVVNIPVTALGGAGSYEDIKALIEQEKIIGAAAGSTFVFKGKYKAVLINYPTSKEKNSILNIR
ncbi:imidazole glycerol phosphate synthase [Vibrio tubiashii]|nr:imidazole glycerol phosphate synthase [Vibrio tubiashii]